MKTPINISHNLEIQKKRLKALADCIKISSEPLQGLQKLEPAVPIFDAPDTDGDWSAMKVGDSWGGKNTWTYFRGKFTVPGSWHSSSIDLCLANEENYLESIAGDNFPAGPEGQVFVDGHHAGAIDKEHTRIRWPFKPDTTYWITAVFFAGRCRCLHNLAQFELELIDGHLESLYYDLDCAMRTAECIGEDVPSRFQLLDLVSGVLDICITVHGRPTNESINRAIKFFKWEYASIEHVPNAVRVAAVGQAHIDLAWQWPLSIGRHKCVRTFSTQIRLLEQYPGWTFLQPGPQVYQWLAKDSPALFERIKQLVDAGRWEVNGGMWVEPDTNLPSGECLVRQILYGKKYILNSFGKDSRCAFLPDTFGFSAALPQLLRLAGIDALVTTKLSWNDTNRFPYDAFIWRGLDGSELPAYFITTMLGASPTPDQVSYNWHEYKQKNTPIAPLLTFGHGDGGGGPTHEMLEIGSRMHRQESVAGCRSLRFTSLGEYIRHASEHSSSLQIWDGELYLERHRGTYTTHGAVKKANRRNAVGLHKLELLASILLMLGRPTQPADIAAIWTDHLMLQFHDILPGSSVGEVYDEVQPIYESIALRIEAAVETMLRSLCERIEISSFRKPLLLLNTQSWDRTEMVATSGTHCELVTVPALGWVVIETDNTTGFVGQEVYLKISADGRSFITKFWELSFNADGSIRCLYDRVNRRQVLQPGMFGNEWQLFAEQESETEAWDIAAETLAARLPAPELDSFSSDIRHDRRIVVYLKWTVGASSIVQMVSLYEWCPRIDFHTEVDWRERHVLLKAAFAFNVFSDRAAFEIQFGHIYRSTKRNTSWEQAQFEVSAQRWIDLSDGLYGVAIMSDSKHGFDVERNIARISCLRGTTKPDAHADIGLHEFTYSLLPHKGSLQESGVVQAAAELNNPLVKRALTVINSSVGLPSTYRSLSSSNPAVVIDTVKPAEDGDGVIMRLYETSGSEQEAVIRFGVPASRVTLTNLLEEPWEDEAGSMGAFCAPSELSVNLKPFQILTLRVKFGNADYWN